MYQIMLISEFEQIKRNYKIDNFKVENYVVIAKHFITNIVAEHGKYHGLISDDFNIWYPLQSFQILKSKHNQINLSVKKHHY